MTLNVTVIGEGENLRNLLNYIKENAEDLHILSVEGIELGYENLSVKISLLEGALIHALVEDHGCIIQSEEFTQ